MINQTTLKYEDIKILHEKILALNPSALIINSICKETLKRQEIIKNTDKLDLLIVVGDESSSNSKELYEIGKTYHKKAIFINCKDKLLNYDFNMINKIGVISGTSTPNFLKNEVINYLKNIKN